MTADPLELAATLVDHGTVGAVQLAYRRAGQVTTASFGACDDASRFALASLTKPLIAAACLVACDEGVLELDGELAAHVPEAAAPATLRELLCHAAGLPVDDPAARRVQLAASTSWSDAATAYATVAPVAARRTQRIYSNVGYALAALMLERAAGMGIREYLRAAVLEPLGMARTALGVASDAADVVHVRQPGLLGHGEQLFNGARFRTLGLPQSGAFGTADDYLRFLVAVAEREPVLLARETRDELLTNQCGALAGGVGGFLEWPRCDWAVGFELRDAKSPHWTGHALSPASATHFGASGTLCFIDPHRDVQAVVLADRGTYSRWMLEPGGWPDLCAALVA